MTGPEDEAGWEASLAPLRRPPADGGLSYHAITLTGEADGTLTFAVCSRWVGWVDRARRIELRVSSPVDAGYAAGLAAIGIRCVFVVDEGDLAVFMAAGGVGLVERTLAERVLPKVMEPFAAYPRGRSGFGDAGALGPGARRRAPSPKARMSVLKRDGMRCRVCGRRPDDHVDVELHVHHIRPWSQGGATEPCNLVTLCHTCHAGLDPHFDRDLFELVEQRDSQAVLSTLRQGAAAYRREIRRGLEGG